MNDHRAASKGSKMTVAIMAGSLGAAIALIWLLRHQRRTNAHGALDAPCAGVIG